MAITNSLEWADYLVIFLTIAVSVAIGIYYRLTGGKQKTAMEYYSANRSMSAAPMGIALMISFMSAITLLGVSSENYIYGTQYVILNVSYLFGVPMVAYLYLPVFYKLQVSTTYEYLERRFGLSVRILASTIVWLQMLLYSGVVLYAPALAFETTTGLSRATSILSTGLACAFYSSIGGIKAVLITDLFQAVLMLISLILIIVIAVYNVGGFAEIWNIASAGGRIEFDNFSIDPTVRHTWWTLVIGGLFTFLSLYGVNQVQVQRLLSIKSLRSAQRSLFVCLPCLIFLTLLTCFSGLAIYSKYYNCDPRAAGSISAADMLMPYYVMDTMGSKPGLPGLFIAGIFSAGLSTISAALNSLSIVSLEDYIKPCYNRCTGKEISESKFLILGKILSFVLGLLCIALAFAAQYLGSVLQTSLTIFGVVGGPLLGLFTLGMLFESPTQRGAFFGTTCSLIFLLWIGFGVPRPATPTLPVSIDGCDFTNFNTNSTTKISDLQNVSSIDYANVTQSNTKYFYLYRLSYLWYAPLGTLITIVVGWITSNLLQYVGFDHTKDVDSELFFPFIAKRINKRNERRKNVKSNESSQKYKFNEEQEMGVSA